VARTAKIDISTVIAAPPGRVVRAFFDAGALNAWWRASCAITLPRVLGPYVIEWESTDERDDLLGRLGGVLRGTVMQIDAAHGFFLADVYWLPPDGPPIGPMALEVTCTATSGAGAAPDQTETTLRIVQTGYDQSARWQRYYEVAGTGWVRALTALKGLLEP
jgi:uncharacterized protein YndB with AHSA1/START domain